MKSLTSYFTSFSWARRVTLRRDPVVLIVLAMLASLLLVFGLNPISHDPTPEDLAAARMQGQVAHEFVLPDTEGKMVHLSDFRGKAVVLNFWATWCTPCKVEMPWFAELQKQYASQGVQILGVDTRDDAAMEDVAAFAKDIGVDYPILVGKPSEQNAVANDYGGMPVLPETVFITRDGKVSEKALGLRTKNQIEESIRKTLYQGGSQQQIVEKQSAPAVGEVLRSPVESRPEILNSVRSHGQGSVRE